MSTSRDECQESSEMRSAIVAAIMSRIDYMLQLEQEMLRGGGVDPMDTEGIDVESGAGSVIAGFRYSAWDDTKLVRRRGALRELKL